MAVFCGLSSMMCQLVIGREFFPLYNTLVGEFQPSWPTTPNSPWSKLIGKIPMELAGSLSKLFALRVSANTLTGGIPPSFGNLSLLVHFSVGYNYLEGNILESIGHLKSLSVFAVGANKLNGMIPSSFYNMSSISVFAFFTKRN